MKQKTFIALMLMGILGLGSCIKAQLSKQVINLDSPDYTLNVEHYCSDLFDFDNPGKGSDTTEVNYRYVKYTKYMYESRTEKYPILMLYINADSLLHKEATFCGFDFGKLNMTTTAKGKLIGIEGEAETNRKRFDKIMKAATKKYGNPVRKIADTDEIELDNILINSMVKKGKNIPVYLWKLEDEYIGLYIKSENNALEEDENESVKAENSTSPITVKIFRIKKELEQLLIKIQTPYIESLKDLMDFERKMFKIAKDAVEDMNREEQIE